jgi:hypothetical protein
MVYRLIKTGLVVIEGEGKPEHFTIIRPALAGTPFFEAGRTIALGANGVHLLSNAPSASLRQIKEDGNEWEVDSSFAAAPGPGPVWFRERFTDVAKAVDAIRDCYFGDRVDFENEALSPQYRRSGPDRPRGLCI